MGRKTKQMEIWTGKFGKEYTNRNDLTLEEMEQQDKKNYGYTRTELNNEFIGNLDRSIKILEVACNIGNQLICLQKMGFKVKEIKNKDAFKITGGDMSKLHLNYISTTSSGNDTIIGGSQFEAITKIK
ncbi:hypothetical protein LCGC14_2312310 [marine sediment metagenome]|uniref:Methyltransferase type 11 domain-containing protein n=1 Tax=marine sediment metagenome TaxID=412755 RepID=A0A0F9CKW5_9ZZZZ